MTLTLPTAADLQTFLGASTIDTPRAMMMLTLAYDLCSTIVSPLPDTAQGVVLTVASRSFVNPEGITAETVGPYSVQRPSPGLYLTKSDKATLRRLGGGATAFSIDTIPAGTSAVQTITVNGLPTGGTFTLNFAGQITTPLAYNATASAVQAALEALPSFGTGNVAVTGPGPFTVTWQNALVTTPIGTLVAVSSLTGGTNPSVTVVSTVDGVYAPGQALPYWDKGYSSSTGGTILGYP